MGADGKIPIPGAKVPTAAEISSAKESLRHCACDEGDTALVCAGIKKDGTSPETQQTFPNACFAKCAGAGWVTPGACVHDGA